MSDYKAEAERLVNMAEGVVWDRPTTDEAAQDFVSHLHGAALINATLYLAEQQRIANVMTLESMPTEQFDRLSVNTSVTAIREGLGL